MTKVIFVFLLGTTLLLCVMPQPLKNDIFQERIAGHVESTAIAIVFLVVVVVTISYCVCCSSKGLKDLGQQNGISAPHCSSNNFPSDANSSEFTIFPPSSAITAQPTGYSDDKVTFEPLPEILPQKSHDHHPTDQLQLAKFNSSLHKGLGDWFSESVCDYFPRNKLQYHQELGTCWFGQVVLGEARGIIESEPSTKVVVKIVKQDATPNEYVNFLQEIRPFRDLHHPNVVKLLGYCLETNPYLFIMEYCPMDLKAYLIHHCDEAEFLLQNGYVLRVACDIATGLQHMHDHDFVHMDLAARNCFITLDNTVKLGGYGTSLQTYKEEYFCQGNIALPLRWCDPDSVSCVMNSVETREVTKAANVWSFGVVLWEVLEFGKLPYFELTDDEVLQKVILERSCTLKAPSTPCIHSDRMYEIMQMCWKPSSTRCSIHHIAALINHLYDNKDLISNPAAFETRWTSLQPHSSEQNLVSTDSAMSRVVLKVKSEFTQNSQMLAPYEHSYVPTSNTSPSHDSNSTGMEVSSISPSMQNLRGSLEDLSTFGLSAESVSSEHVSHHIVQPKIDLVSSKDILPQPLAAPVSSNELICQSKEIVEMDNCKTLSSHNSSNILADQSSHIKESFHSPGVDKKADITGIVLETNVFTGSFQEECERKESLDGLFSVQVNDEIDKEIDIFTDREKCNCDKHCLERDITDRRYKCMCSLNLSAESSIFKNMSKSDSNNMNTSSKYEEKKEDKDCTDNVQTEDSDNFVNSNNIDISVISFEHMASVDVKGGFSDSDGEKYTTSKNSEDKKFTYKNCTALKDETLCTCLTHHEKSDSISDAALLGDLTVSSDVDNFNATPCKAVFPDNSGAADGKFSMLSNDETRILSLAGNSTYENSFNNIEKTETELLQSHHLAPALSNDNAIHNQPRKNVLHSSKPLCSRSSLEGEIEPGGSFPKNFGVLLSRDVLSGPDYATNSDEEMCIKQNVLEEKQDTNEEVDVFSASKRTMQIPVSKKTNHKEEKYEDDLFSELTNETSKVSYDTVVPQNVNEQKKAESFGCYYYKRRDDDSNRRPDSLKCQSTEPVILVTECSTSPGSQSEGDEYQLEDISSVLKEDEQTSVNNSAVCSSSIEHNSLFLSDNERVLSLPVGVYSSDEVGSSEWNSDCTHATYSNYWTERIPISGASSKNKEEHTSKSLSDVVTIEDLDTGCEKDIVACYEPYQDPFETDEVLSIDTETNVAVLLDSHHSVIGFVPSKVDMFAGSRDMEDEVLSSSEIQSNLSDIIDGNAQIYVNGYKSSESASPRSLCSSSTDFSANADQRSETSVDSDFVPDLSVSHSTSECKASSESNSKSSTEQDQEILSKQHYINNINLDFKILDIGSKDNSLVKNIDYGTSCRDNNIEGINSQILYRSEDSVSPGRDAYTPDFDSDTDDTSSTGTTCTSTSGSFECLYKSSKAVPSESVDADHDENQSDSPVQVFSVTWDRNATPTKSSMKSPEKKGGQMKKSVSFQEEDPPLFSYPPESEGSDDESRGLDYPANFLWNVDYSVYTDWDFQSSLDLEEIPEDIVEVEDPEDDDEYLTFRYKSLPLRPLQVYTFTDITDDDDESASLRTNLSEVDTAEESTNSRGIYLEVKSDEEDNSPSPSNSIPNEVCQEVIEMYPTFDDLSVMLETNGSGEELPHKNNLTTSYGHDIDSVTSNTRHEERYYLEFAKPDSSFSAEHNLLSEGTTVDSENNVSSIATQYSHYNEVNNSPRNTEHVEGNNALTNADGTKKEHLSEFIHETGYMDAICGNIYSKKNGANFCQKDSYFNEISGNIEQMQKLEVQSAAVSDSSTSEKERYWPETDDKLVSIINDEICGQNSNVPSPSFVELSSELDNKEQSADYHSPLDILFNMHSSSFEDNDKSNSLTSSDVQRLSVNYTEANKTIKEVTGCEFEKPGRNTNRPKSLPPFAANHKSPFVQHYETNFDEPQSVFASTRIGDENSSEVLCLSKDDTFIDKLDNSNVASGINTNQTYYSLISDETDIPVMNAEYQECRNSMLYEDVADGKDISESSLSSKSTEDSSEKDSAISSGGEFSPVYSPGIVQESKDGAWDFQHSSKADNSENLVAVENTKDDNENGSAGPVDMDTSALLPDIVVSDSDNVNFTIHTSGVLQTYNNFRYEHNGNIPTDVTANLAMAACDKNDNIVQE